MRQEDEQIFSPAAEKAVIKWILKLDSYGFSPRVDILMGLVKHLAKEDAERQIQKNPIQKNLIGKNWIAQFLNRHSNLSLKFASRIDRKRACAGPRVLTNHFTKIGKITRQFLYNLVSLQVPLLVFSGVFYFLSIYLLFNL